MSRETQSKFNDTREKNAAQQKELRQNDSRIQELIKDLETQRKELLGVNTQNKKLNSSIDHLNQSEINLMQKRDDLNQKVRDLEASVEISNEDAAKAEQEKKNVVELLQSLSEAVNPKIHSHETDAEQSAADLAEVAEQCRTAVQQNQSEAQSAQVPTLLVTSAVNPQPLPSSLCVSVRLSFAVSLCRPLCAKIRIRFRLRTQTVKDSLSLPVCAGEFK